MKKIITTGLVFNIPLLFGCYWVYKYIFMYTPMWGVTYVYKFRNVLSDTGGGE